MICSAHVRNLIMDGLISINTFALNTHVLTEDVGSQNGEKRIQLLESSNLNCRFSSLSFLTFAIQNSTPCEKLRNVWSWTFASIQSYNSGSRVIPILGLVLPMSDKWEQTSLYFCSHLFGQKSDRFDDHESKHDTSSSYCHGQLHENLLHHRSGRRPTSSDPCHGGDPHERAGTGVRPRTGHRGRGPGKDIEGIVRAVIA